MLHYPAHLWFLYEAMKYTSLLTTLLFGAFMAGLACVMVRQAHAGQAVSFRAALLSRQARYGRLALVWGASWLVANLTVRAIALVAPASAVRLGLQVGLALIVQTLVAYAILLAVVDGAVWWSALARSARETLRYPLSSLATVTAALAGVIACSLIAAPYQVARWMAQTQPELALLFVVGRWLLWHGASALLVVAIAHLWCFHHLPTSALRMRGHAAA